MKETYNAMVKGFILLAVLAACCMTINTAYSAELPYSLTMTVQYEDDSRSDHLIAPGMTRDECLVLMGAAGQSQTLVAEEVLLVGGDVNAQAPWLAYNVVTTDEVVRTTLECSQATEEA